MTYEIKNTTFGELEIGAQFRMDRIRTTPTKRGILNWFKRSSRTAVGLTNHQGPLGRNWDYFSKDDFVHGEVRKKPNEP